jgi:hypothetical protein
MVIVQLPNSPYCQDNDEFDSLLDDGWCTGMSKLKSSSEILVRWWHAGLDPKVSKNIMPHLLSKGALCQKMRNGFNGLITEVTCVVS